MSETSFRVVNPTLFGWGIYQEYGWPILFGSSLLYFLAFAACALFIRRAAINVGWPRVGLVAGLLGLWPVIVACGTSLSLQLTSSHFQFHDGVIRRLTVSVGGFAVLWLLTERFGPPTHPARPE
jgi:hypothetical protein